jgi:hypothetical protein
MANVTANKGAFTVKAYIGDNKTLLAFDFTSAANAKNLAGFTIQCLPPGQEAYYLWNELQFQDPTRHSQVAAEKPNSTVNAPIQKYRWTHVPGTNHQGLNPVVGNYTYTVTPRYFDTNQSMTALDNSLSVSVTVPVGPFKKGSLSLGFTRGYMQSEAFVHHFGPQTPIAPTGKTLQFDTSAKAGTFNGQDVTFAEIYAWMGFSARQKIFALLNAVLTDNSLHLDVFAYDLNEPDVITIFLKLATQGRIRIILDNSSEHHTTNNSKPEDQFTVLFTKQAKGNSSILRGCFDRYSHDKIFIVSRNEVPIEVLTGSTNFSVTGLYVNANHVLVFDDPGVAGVYLKVFEESWQILSQYKTKSKAAATAFAGNPVASPQAYAFQSTSVPRMSVTFSPHTVSDTNQILNAISSRIDKESSVPEGNVLFAVMQLTGSATPVYETLKTVHENQKLYSYGISDAPGGVYLYSSHSRDGVLVTGKPGRITLPAPFDQVPSLPGHEIHDKFVVCGLNGNDPVVYCGSSNLATGGEESNGDNLLQIHDGDVATAFAIEALLLIDHYSFLDRHVAPKGSTQAKKGSSNPLTKKSVATKPKATATKKKPTRKPPR